MKTSIIIPTRNRPEWISRCINHLLKQIPSVFEILIIDASNNTSTESIITGKYPFARYFPFRNGLNKRPEAKNIGMLNAQGDILAFLDDDSLVQDGWLKSCVDTFSSEEIGMVGGRVIDINDPNLAQINDSGLIGRISFTGIRINNFGKITEKVTPVDHLRGGNMAVRKNLLKLIGGYDTYFTGTNVFEETDVCTRIKKLGYKILYNPDMLIEHHFAKRDDIERKLSNKKTIFYICRNGMYYMLSNFSPMRSLAHFFLANTHIKCFLNTWSFENFYLIFFHLNGKFFGLLAFCKSLIKKHRRGVYINA